MSRLQIDVSIGIMRELYFSPRRSSALHVAFRSNINLGKYLDCLSQQGYLANREGLYECTSKGSKAIAAYDRLLEGGLITEEDGIRATDLVMLRELGDGSYRAAVSQRSRSIIKQRLTEIGFAAEGGLTAEGRQILGLATDLFELAERLHTSRKAAE